MATKITLIGKPEMGKTTIKKVIFEGEDPSDLVLFPLEATIKLTYSVYNFLDTKVSLIDAPGQSLSQIFEEDEKQILAFADSNAIIYVFDYPTWISDSQDIIDDVRKIADINKKHQFEAKIILFLHKIDLIISKKIGKLLSSIMRQIQKQIGLPEELPIYFTSLHPNLIYTKKTIALKDLLKSLLEDTSKTSCLVTNPDNYLLIQEMSKDFDANILYYIYEEVHRLSTTSEITTTRIDTVSLGPKIFNRIIENMRDLNSSFKHIMLFSETLGKEDMIKVLDEIRINLKS
jgi:hypothetical protein